MLPFAGVAFRNEDISPGTGEIGALQQGSNPYLAISFLLSARTL